MYMCIMFMLGAHRIQKRASDPTELDILLGTKPDFLVSYCKYWLFKASPGPTFDLAGGSCSVLH